jgi:GNAT superfamily N-acetyltransferase
MAAIIRPAKKSDSEKLWTLMQKLAVFEKYIDSFAITPEVIIESGFSKNPPDFYCLVAEQDSELIGMLVYYFLPYTAQNRPAIYLKELFVEEDHRGQKVGEQLMIALRRIAKRKNCIQIKWHVAPWNEAGQRFYQRFGARENKDWLSYELNLSYPNSDI